MNPATAARWPADRPLTERQEEVLRLIAGSDWYPTIREIREALGVASTFTVWGHLRVLEGRGYVTRKAKGCHGIKSTPEGDAYLAGREGAR